MKDMHKKLFRKVGARMMFFITINFYIIVLFAMLGDDTVYVLFNHFNEAKIEYVMYAIILPFVCYSFLADIIGERRLRRRVRMSTIQDVLKVIEENANPFVTKPQIVSILIKGTEDSRTLMNRKVSRALRTLIKRKKQVIEYYPRGANEPKGYCLRDKKVTL